MDLSKLSTRDIIGLYYLALETSRDLAWVAAVSNLFKSDQALERYPFLGQTPALREWVGGRQAKGLRQNEFTVRNKHYEATMEFALTDLRRDKTDQIKDRIAEFIDQDVRHWATLVSNLLLNGGATVCYDGQYFFDTDHSEGDSGAQSNSITVDISVMPAVLHGTPTAPSVEEMQHMILKGIAQILSLTDDRGQPMNQSATRFLVLAPTSLWLTASQAVGPIATINNSAANLNANVLERFSVDVAMNSELNTWTDKIAIFRTDAPIKAFIRQNETELQIKAKDEDSDYAFDNDAVQIGVDVWRAADYGFWQRACLVQAV